MKTVVNLLAGVVLGVAVILVPTVASAHVTVKPSQVAPAAYQTFTVNVPNEKDIPVTAVRLVVPAGLQSVTPTVKPGWEIAMTKTGDDVTEINWTGGTIAAGLRDEFTFSAQAPAQTGQLVWKAYQTYQDGETVAWDQAQTTNQGHTENAGPYSITAVEKVTSEEAKPSRSDSSVNSAYGLSGIALVLSLIAVLKAKKDKK